MKTHTYRTKRQSEVEAIRYGPVFRPGLVQEVAEFIAGREIHDEADCTAFIRPAGAWDPPDASDIIIEAGKDGKQGWVPVPLGHWIVRQPGDFTDHWPVDPDYFDAKYEPVAFTESDDEDLRDGSREGDQQPPTVNEHPIIQELVRSDLADRLALGVKRYGTGLQPHNGRDMLKDAYDEAMDLVVYLRGVLYERDGA